MSSSDSDIGTCQRLILLSGSITPTGQHTRVLPLSYSEEQVSHAIEVIESVSRGFKDGQDTLLSLDTLCRAVKAVHRGIGSIDADWQKILADTASELQASKTAEERREYISAIITLQNIANGLRHAVDLEYHATEMAKGNVPSQITPTAQKLDLLLARSRAAAWNSEQQTAVLRDIVTLLRPPEGDTEETMSAAPHARPGQASDWMRRWMGARNCGEMLILHLTG